MSVRKSDADAYLRWIIASEYYDGAMAGIGERAVDGAIVWFRVVAWDDELWRRVFAVTAVETSQAMQLVQDLEKAEPRKMPFWLPGPTSVTPDTQKGWDEIADAAIRSNSWRLVEAHELDKPSIECIVPAAVVPHLIAGVRAGSVLDARGPSLTDDYLQQVRFEIDS
jgi:hypothetical protein